MSKGLKIAVTALLIAVFFGAVYFVYGTLKDEYAPDAFSDPAESGNGDNNGYMDAPDFTVLNMEGEEVKLSDYFGKPIVLNFWATWCYYCNEEMPDFNKAYKENPDVQFLMVNATDGVQETVEKAKTYLTENGFEFPVVFDTKQEAVYAYYVTGYPCTYFINKEGRLVTYANGMLSYDNLIKGIGFITGENDG